MFSSWVFWFNCRITNHDQKNQTNLIYRLGIPKWHNQIKNVAKSRQDNFMNFMEFFMWLVWLLFPRFHYAAHSAFHANTSYTVCLAIKQPGLVLSFVSFLFRYVPVRSEKILHVPGPKMESKVKCHQQIPYIVVYEVVVAVFTAFCCDRHNWVVHTCWPFFVTE